MGFGSGAPILMDKTCLKALLDEHGLRYRQNSVSYILGCPRCRKEKLYISQRSGRFICFYCSEISGFKGRAEYALCELTDLSIEEIQHRLYEGGAVQGFLLELGDDDGLVEETADEFSPVEWPLNYYPIEHPHAAKGASYLEGRGIPVEIAREYQIRYAPKEQRVVFPIYVGPQLVGWQGRLVVPHRWFDEEEECWREVPKVLSSRGIPRERVLMFDNRLAGSEHAIICEGPVSAIKAHLCGGNVATMGKAVAKKQIRRIVEAGVKRIYLALDPDAADEVSRLAYEFADLECYTMFPPAPCGDVGEMSMEAVLELFRCARPLKVGQFFLYWK